MAESPRRTPNTQQQCASFVFINSRVFLSSCGYFFQEKVSYPCTHADAIKCRFLLECCSNVTSKGSADTSAQELARQIAQAWLESNYKGYLQNGGKMVEKYDGITPGVSGGGGEYDVQTGFGWTNGVMLYFLQRYGWNPDLKLPTNYTSDLSTSSV